MLMGMMAKGFLTTEGLGFFGDLLTTSASPFANVSRGHDGSPPGIGFGTVADILIVYV